MNSEKFKKITVDGNNLVVGDHSTILFGDTGVRANQYINWFTGYISIHLYDRAARKYRMRYVHRIVAAAFLGDVDGKQVDHVNGDRADNRLKNLRIVTRKQNNGRLSARKLRSVNHKAQSHEGQVVRCMKGGKVEYFETGIEAARFIGCTRQLVYRVLNPQDWPRTAKGWALEWIPSAAL